MKKLKFVVERHRDGYVAYPLGLKGAVVGEGRQLRISARRCQIRSRFSY
jgi:hypothetical protein